jgi:hypothetical protein
MVTSASLKFRNARNAHGDPAINLLLDRGAQVEPPVAGAPVFNANPFFLASYAGNAKSLKRLLAFGGKLDEAMIAIETSSTTPMLGALKFGDIELARTKDGLTPSSSPRSAAMRI